MSNPSGYEAFISYKHNPVDTKVAKDVQRRIEHYRIPKDIQKKTGIQKFRRVFRDTSELSGSADLPADIENALRNSDYLIVICSKRTYASRWVVREIEMFLENHDIGHVLTVLVDGEPREVIPEILLRERKEVVALDGTVHVEERELEPLSCDYRNGFRVARNQEIPRLAARFLGCDYDELYRREMRYRNRQILGVLSIILTFLIAATSYLLWSNREIKKNYDESVRQKLIYSSTLGRQYLDEGRREAALKTGISSAGMLTEDELTMAPELLWCMEDASRIYNYGNDGAFDNIVNTQEFFMEGSVSQIKADITGKYVGCADYNKNMYIWSVEQKRMIYRERWREYISDIQITAEGQAFVTAESTICCINCETGEKIWEQNYASPVIHLFEESDSIIGIVTNNTILYIDRLTSDIVGKASLKDYITGEIIPNFEAADIFLVIEAKSPNGRWLCVDIYVHDALFEREYYKGIFDIEGKHIYVLDETSFAPNNEDSSYRLHITNEGDIYSVELPDNSSGECYISKISATEGVKWTKNWNFIRAVKLRSEEFKSCLGTFDNRITGVTELLVVIGSRALILDALSGETLQEIALSADAMLYSGEATYFFMQGMIGFRNALGGVSSIKFPVEDFEDFLCITERESWNRTDEFIFVNGRNVYIYQKINDNEDVVRYSSAAENVYVCELVVLRDGVIQINEFESGVVSICKYTSDNRTCVWSTVIPERVKSIIGIDQSEEYLYLSLESDTREPKAVCIDLKSGDDVVFKVPDSHYQTEPYERSSIIDILGVQKGTLIYYSRWFERDEDSYVVCRYDPKNDELEEYKLPFSIQYRIPGAVFSDNQLVCLSEHNEIYVFNTETWEYTLLDDEYVCDDSIYHLNVFSPKDGMYVIYPSGGFTNETRLNLYEENIGKVYSIDSTSEIITARSYGDILYILYSDGILSLYDLLSGKFVDKINLDTSLDFGLVDYNDNIKETTDNELIVSCSDGVFVIDMTYKTIRTHVQEGIGYDAENDGFYLSFDNKGGWIKHYSAVEVLERIKQMISTDEQ